MSANNHIPSDVVYDAPSEDEQGTEHSSQPGTPELPSHHRVGVSLQQSVDGDLLDDELNEDIQSSMHPVDDEDDAHMYDDEFGGISTNSFSHHSFALQVSDDGSFIYTTPYVIDECGGDDDSSSEDEHHHVVQIPSSPSQDVERDESSSASTHVAGYHYTPIAEAETHNMIANDVGGDDVDNNDHTVCVEDDHPLADDILHAAVPPTSVAAKQPECGDDANSPDGNPHIPEVSRVYTNTICEMYDDSDDEDEDANHIDHHGDGDNSNDDSEDTNLSLHRSWLPDLCTCVVRGYIGSQWIRRRSGFQHPLHLKQYIVWTQLLVLAITVMVVWAAAEVDKITFYCGIVFYIIIAVVALPAFGLTTFLENQSYKLANIPKTIEEVDQLDQRLYQQGLEAYTLCEAHQDKRRAETNQYLQEEFEYHPLQFFVPVRSVQHDLSRRPFWKKPYIYYLQLFGMATSEGTSDDNDGENGGVLPRRELGPVVHESAGTATAAAAETATTTPCTTTDVETSSSSPSSQALASYLPKPTTWWPHHLLSIFEVQQLCGVYPLLSGVPSQLHETLEKYESIRTKHLLSKGRNERVAAGDGHVFTAVDHRLRLNRASSVHGTIQGEVGFFNSEVVVMRQHALRGTYVNYHGQILCLPFHFKLLPGAQWPGDDSIQTPVPIFSIRNPIQRPLLPTLSNLAQQQLPTPASGKLTHHEHKEMTLQLQQSEHASMMHSGSFANRAVTVKGGSGSGDIEQGLPGPQHTHNCATDDIEDKMSKTMHVNTRRGKLIAIDGQAHVNVGDNKDGIVTASSRFVSDLDHVTVCTKCRIIQDDHNMVHCTFCHKCIEGFDHHCPFLNTCIGVRNYPSFFTLISFILLYESFSVYIFTRLLLLVFDIDITGNGDTFLSFNHYLFGTHKTAAMIVYILALIWASAGLFLIGCLVFFHVFLILTKQTTRGFLRSRRIAMRVRREEKAELRRVKDAQRKKNQQQQQQIPTPHLHQQHSTRGGGVVQQPSSAFSFTYDIELTTPPLSNNYLGQRHQHHQQQYHHHHHQTTPSKPSKRPASGGSGGDDGDGDESDTKKGGPQRALFGYSTIHKTKHRGSFNSTPHNHSQATTASPATAEKDSQPLTIPSFITLHHGIDDNDDDGDMSSYHHHDDHEKRSPQTSPHQIIHQRNKSSPDTHSAGGNTASTHHDTRNGGSGSRLQSSQSSADLVDFKRVVRIHNHQTSSPTSKESHPSTMQDAPHHLSYLNTTGNDTYHHAYPLPSPSLTSHYGMDSTPDHEIPSETNMISQLDEYDDDVSPSQADDTTPDHHLSSMNDHHDMIHDESSNSLHAVESSDALVRMDSATSYQAKPGNLQYSVSNLPAVNEVLPSLDSSLQPRLAEP